MFKQHEISETTSDHTEIATVDKAAMNAHEAMTFMCGLNQTRYQSLMDDLSNSYLNGRDEYPKDLVAAYNLDLNRTGSNRVAPIGENDAV